MVWFPARWGTTLTFIVLFAADRHKALSYLLMLIVHWTFRHTPARKIRQIFPPDAVGLIGAVQLRPRHQ